MIDLKQLNEIDLKDINFSAVQASLLKRKDILTNLVFIFVSIFMGYFLWQNTSKTIMSLKAEIENLEQKNVAILELEKQNQLKQDFIKNFPDGFSGFTAIIDYISVLADKSNIKIASFNPKSPEMSDLFIVSTVDFELLPSHYENVLDFIKTVEQSQMNVKINFLSARNFESRGLRQGMRLENVDQTLYNIQISSIRLRNEK